ncbi:MAG: hypothetical protein RR640_00285 [Oscillospiraceae bacterium]
MKTKENKMIIYLVIMILLVTIASAIGASATNSKNLSKNEDVLTYNLNI